MAEAGTPPGEPRRVVVPIAIGMSLRNILRTDLHSEMVARGLRPVYLVPSHLVPGLAEEFRDESCDFDALPAWSASAAEVLLGDLSFAVVQNRHRLKTIEINKRRLRRNERRVPVKERLFPLLGRSDLAFRGLDGLRRLLFRGKGMETVLAKWKPALVFSNNVFHPVEAAVLRAARAGGVPTVGMVLSWDNPSNKGILPARAGHLLVWSDTMRDEMVRYFGLAPDHMTIVGTPQFDIYARPLDVSPEEVRAHYGFEPDCRLLLFATGAVGHFPDEHVYPTAVARLAAEGGDRPVRLLVRLHPRDHRERYEHLEQMPGVVVAGAGGASAAYSDRWYPSEEDHLHYAALMRHSDVVLNLASTAALDAAANDTPAVNVAYEVEPGVDYLDSAGRLLDFTHTKRLLTCGATYLARSEEELIELTRRALERPGELADRRRALAMQEGYDGRGGSAVKIAEVLAARAGAGGG